MKHILTKKDLLRNPDLALWGLKEGDEIEIPGNQNLTDENEDDHGGGIEIPKKPPIIP